MQKTRIKNLLRRKKTSRQSQAFFSGLKFVIGCLKYPLFDHGIMQRKFRIRIFMIQTINFSAKIGQN